MKRKDRRESASRKAYPRILYSTKRTPMSLKDLSPKEGGKKTPLNLVKNSFLCFKAKISELFCTRKTKRLPSEKGSKTFYAILAGTGAAVMLATVAITLFIFNPQGVNITINDSGRITDAHTSEITVGAFLSKNGINLGKSDVVELALTEPLKDGMNIVIRRATPVTINYGTEKYSVDMLAGTVGDALTLASITPGVNDEIYPDVSSYISPGMEINVIKVDTTTFKERESIPFKEKTKKTDKLNKGKTKLVQDGEEGILENTIRVVYKNNKIISKTKIGEKVVRDPVDEITHVGTYEPPPPSPTPTKSTQPSKPAPTSTPADEDGKEYLTKVPTTNKIHSGTLYEHKRVPPPSDKIIAKTVVIDHITAYTHTGNRTATGTWPRIGTIAADPKRFPYGTKVYVPGYGYGRIEDTGGFRNKPRTQFDLFMETEKECYSWGRKRNVKIYILKNT